MKNIIMIGNLSYNINLFLNSFVVEGSKHSIVKKTKSLGNILNIAILLSKYNLDVWYFSSVGDDLEGKEIINSLHANAIHSDYVNILNNTKTNKNYILRNLKNNSKTIIYERNNNKYELIRNMEFNPEIIYTDSSNFELSRLLKEKFLDTKLIITIDKLDEEVINICKIADYIIIPLKYAEILSSVKFDQVNKKSIIDLYMKTNKLFSATIVIYDERIGSLYQNNNRINIVPKLGKKDLFRENSFDVYKSTFIYGIANNFDIDKVIKLSCISKFLYDNNKLSFNIEEVIRIYEQNN